MVNHSELSEHHACAFVGLSRHTYYHESQTSALNGELGSKIGETACTSTYTRRRYHIFHDVLSPQCPNINHKRVYRLFTTEVLSIRKSKKTKRIGVRIPLVAALAVNQAWEACTLPVMPFVDLASSLGASNA